MLLLQFRKSVFQVDCVLQFSIFMHVQGPAGPWRQRSIIHAQFCVFTGVIVSIFTFSFSLPIVRGFLVFRIICN